jgi:hypothetical protein
VKKVNESEANKEMKSKMNEIQRILDQAGGSLASVEIAEASANSWGQQDE